MRFEEHNGSVRIAGRKDGETEIPKFVDNAKSDENIVLNDQNHA